MEKLLAIVDLSQRVYGKWLLKRLLPGILIVAGLIVVVGCMASALLVAALIGVYYALLYYGIGQTLAVMITIILAILIMAALVALIRAYLIYLRRMPKKLLTESPLTSHACKLLDAFADGLMAE